ncbi:hypothetical protein BD413DRAFT_610791 [Trametes elegans]|nr:hypothetical protein BD413DRAFT_610791 [Trametes elegans]
MNPLNPAAQQFGLYGGAVQQPQVQPQPAMGMQWPGQYWQQLYQAPQAMAAPHQPMQPAQWPAQLQGILPPPPPNVNTNDFLASLATALQPYMQQQKQQKHPHQEVQLPESVEQRQPLTADQPEHHQPRSKHQNLIRSTPVGTVVDDERRLVSALRHIKAKGITARQAFEELHGVNDHDAFAWKDYFLDHLERLYTPGGPAGEGPSRTSESAFGGSTTRVASNASTRRDDGDSAHPPRSRRTRGESPAVFHAGTCIPPSFVRMRPKPPIRDGSELDWRFTDADKIFFIRYLRWRLAESPNITKGDLYRELAQAIPRHDADAWKRHWDSYPQVPDRILIDAQRRVPHAISPAGPSKVLPNVRRQSTDSHTSEEYNTTIEDEGEDETDRETISRTYTQRPRQGKERNFVTDSDLQRMAQYLLEENLDIWDGISGRERWRSFAERPENQKWTLARWVAISNYGTHKNKVRAYYAALKAKSNQSASVRQDRRATLASHPPPASAERAPVFEAGPSRTRPSVDTRAQPLTATEIALGLKRQAPESGGVSSFHATFDDSWLSRKRHKADAARSGPAAEEQTDDKEEDYIWILDN